MYVQSSADIKTDNNKVNLRQTTMYPWNGSVKIAVSPESAKEFALRLRIPGWSQDAPVPTDLYSFTASPKQKVEVKVNGKKADYMVGNGYATLMRIWNPGDVVEISIPMEVRMVKANDNVKDDKGKLAIQRGPVMFCLEGKDQADSTVFDKFIPDGTAFTEKYKPQFLSGVMTLSGKANKVTADGIKEVDFKAIPYCTWNNRGADYMAVWIPSSQDAATVTPKSTIASHAVMYSEPTDLTSDAPAATSNLNYA